MSETEELIDAVLWDMLDFLVEHPFAPTDQVIAGIKDMIARDPEGAARRAHGAPQYDLGRAPKINLNSILRAGGHQPIATNGGEHEPVPDGGSDSGKPHPEGSTEPEEQPAPEPQAPPEPYWPVDPSYTRPDTEPASPEDFALANDCS